MQTVQHGQPVNCWNFRILLPALFIRMIMRPLEELMRFEREGCGFLTIFLLQVMMELILRKFWSQSLPPFVRTQRQLAG